MSVPKWSERYNCHSLQLPGGLSIGVNWSTDRAKTGYSVFFNDVCLAERSQSLTEGKARGIRLARKVLTEALVALDEYEKVTEGNSPNTPAKCD